MRLLKRTKLIGKVIAYTGIASLLVSTAVEFSKILKKEIDAEKEKKEK